MSIVTHLRRKHHASDPNNPTTANIIGYWAGDEYSAGTSAVTRVAQVGSNFTDIGTNPSRSGPGGGADAIHSESDSYLNATAPSQTFHNSDHTVSLWMLAESGTATYSGVIGQYTATGTSTQHWLLYLTNGKPYYILGSAHECWANSDIRSAGWKHIVCRRSSNVLTIWVDGVKQTNTKSGLGTYGTGTQHLVTGHYEGYSSKLVGGTCEMAIFDRALTDAEIEWSYHGGVRRVFSDYTPA